MQARRQVVLRSFLSAVLFAGVLVPLHAQNGMVVDRAQDAIRQRIVSGRGGEVIFPRVHRAETYFVSNAQTGVRGKGNYIRDNRSIPQSFSYDAVVNTTTGNVERADFRFDGGEATVPSWLIGSFRGRNPQSGVATTVVIDPAGNVTATYDNGGVDRGYYSNGRIQFGRALTWDVERKHSFFGGESLRIASAGRAEKFRRLK